MYKVKKYSQGTFSWADNSSTNTAAAKTFYEKVMGWGANDVPMGEGQVYTLFQCDGADAAGLGPMQPEMVAAGVPSNWTSYVTVDDVDAMTAKVKKLGGTVIAEPFDVFDNGRMTVLQDPTGATVALWQPNTHIGAGVVNKPGAMSWNELYTRDVAKARDFYGTLLGWTFQKVEGMEYYTIQNNGRMNGGIMELSPEWGDAPSHWMVYFSVEDVDKTAEAIKANGGTLHGDIMDAGGIGRFVLADDPSGAAAAYIQLDAPDSWSN
ncbi:MAG: VOC family protein [Chloroflexi bacterium]|nr:VOC family protein [Chloroflexota bacterium]